MVTKEHGPNILGRNWLTPLGFRVEGIEEVHLLSSPDELQGDNLNHDFLRLPAVTGVGTGRYNGPPHSSGVKPGSSACLSQSKTSALRPKNAGRRGGSKKHRQWKMDTHEACGSLGYTHRSRQEEIGISSAMRRLQRYRESRLVI